MVKVVNAAHLVASQESLRESRSQVTLLEQREQERVLERKRDREKEQDAEVLKELEVKVQALVEQGLVQMERSSSGHLDVQVVQQILKQKGQHCFYHTSSIVKVVGWLKPR